METSQRNQNEIVNWAEFSQTPMWKMIKSLLQKKISEAESIIFAVGADRKAEYTKRDIAVVKRDAYLELVNMPEKMIDELSSTGEFPMEEMDAYEQEGEEENEVKRPDILDGVDIGFIEDIKPIDQDFNS